MTDHDAALRFDQALDGTYAHNLNGVEPLLQTAHRIQSRYDQQHAMPSEEFVMQLEQSLFPTLGRATAAGVDPAVAAPPPPAMPRPVRALPTARGLAHSRLVAIAAVLVLLIGGMGAILGGPLDPRSDPSPSVIPAASFGTAEASPVASEMWTVASPAGTNSMATGPILANGLLYGIYYGTNGVYAQAVELGTNTPLWSTPLSMEPTVAAWRDQFLYTATGGPGYELFSLAGRTGEEQWTIPVAQRPVNLIVEGDTAYLLGSGNLVQAFDLETRQQRWHADLSAFDPDQSVYGGQNRFVYTDDGRLSLADGVLAVVTSSGRLAALDAADGSVRWSDQRAPDGQVTVSVIDDRFVVTAAAQGDGTIAGDPYSHPPSPVAGYDPQTEPCQRTIAPRTASTTEPLGDYGQTIDGYDPATGASPWGVRTHAAVWTFPADDSSLIAMIRPGWDPEISNEDANIYCLIDGATGAVTETSGIEFVDVVVQGDDPSALWGIGGTIQGIPLYVPLTTEAAQAFPQFEVDFETHVGVRWIQRDGNQILISMQDGTLFGLPENAPRWTDPSPATPESMPVAAVEPWTVAPPLGTQMSDRPNLIADGLVYSFFSTQVQVVDIERGAALWSGPLPIQPYVVAVADDGLLLAAGAVGMESRLVAFDGRTGEERWTLELESRPVGLYVSGDQIFVLGANNLLDAFDRETREGIWQLDLREFDPVRSDYGGANLSGDFTGDRLTMIDGTLGVIVSNGRLAAVDSADGELIWANARQTEGWTRVKVVDGKFVVIAYGPDSNVYDPDATPVPAIPRDPAVDPCTLTIAQRAGSTPQEASGIDATVDAFDPATGASPWGLHLPEQYFVWPLDDSRLIAQVESVESAGIADGGELFNCVIDGSTGALSMTTSGEFTDVAVGSAERDTLYGFGALPDGIALWTGALDRSIAASFPYLDMDSEMFSGLMGGFRWIQTADGMILITGQDGTLIGLPENAPRWNGATAATPSATVTDSGWVLPAPDVDPADFEESWPVVANGTIFRSFYTTTAANDTQAVDMTTGVVRWDVPLDVRGEVMATAGDLLLVGGRLDGLLKEFALVALDQITGEEVWRTVLSELPVAMVVDGDRAYVVGLKNQLDAIDLSSGASIYSTNLTGTSNPNVAYQSAGVSDRLALDGDLLVAVLADGTVAGVDADTGTVHWWNFRKWTRDVHVRSFEGTLIVTEFSEGLDDLFGETVGAPEAMGTPMPASCPGAVSPASPVTDSDVYEGTTPEIAYLRLDPETGKILWSVATDQATVGQFVSGIGIVYLESTAETWPTTIEGWPTDASQLAICSIDPSTGAISAVSDVSSLGSAPFVMAVTSDGVQRSVIGVALEDDQLIFAPAELDPTVIEPMVSVDLDANGGTSWIRIIGDALYIASWDGRLEKITIPSA